MAGLGEMLRAARQDMGVSLAEVEQATKVRRRYLAALEEEDFASLPETIYVLGLLKTYARYLGLDPEQAVHLFEEQSGRRELSGVQPETRLLRETARTGFNPAPLAGLVILVGLALLLFYGYQQYAQLQQAVDPPSVVDKHPTAAPAVPTATEVPIVAATATRAPSPTPTPAQGVTVELKVVGNRCWVRAIVDDRVDKMDGEMLNPGDTRVWKGERYVRLRVGYAAAADITVNGEHLGIIESVPDVREWEWRGQS